LNASFDMGIINFQLSRADAVFYVHVSKERTMKMNISVMKIFILVVLAVSLLSGCGKKGAGQWEPQEFDLPESGEDQGVQVLPADDADGSETSPE
jgi:predicted small lipoprotein YifL